MRHGESRKRNDNLIVEWFAKNGSVSRYTLTVDDLCILYIKYTEQYYRKNGEPTNEVIAMQNVTAT